MNHRIPRVYYYPNTKSKESVAFDTGSSYLRFLLTALKKKWTFVNIGNQSKVGIFDLVSYINRIDILLLNWIENIPDKRLGLFQTLFFLLILVFLHFFNVKVIWIMHNKGSHVPTRIHLKKAIIKALLKRSDLVITHAYEGIDYARKEFRVSGDNIKYLPHPFMKSYRRSSNPEIIYDIVIWGKIWQYKGIDRFLHYLKENDLLHDFKIMVAGTIYPENYKKELLSYSTPEICFDSRFIPDEELDKIIDQSNIVLFTYEGTSTLSSAALMDSFTYVDKLIIGPHVGAFADLANDGLIYTYHNYSELTQMLKDITTLKKDPDRRIDFIKNNTWDSFANLIYDWMNE